MQKEICALLLVLLAAFSGHVSAVDLPIAKYAAMKNSSEFQFYIVGAESGISYANGLYWKAGQPMLFCVPPKKVIPKEEVFHLTERGVSALLSDPEYLKANDSQKSLYTVTEALLRELIKEYPCKKKA